ncbi:MAG: hypothetical protein COB36_01720 [Alphaproteobacteria bacterium]|nr:MAG: hypothetical protein COB36_01720 [Alphaproteobacteria bacterium]
MRDHFIYLEIKQSVLSQLLQRETPISVDLSEFAEILHIQRGEWPSAQDQETIEQIYNHTTDEHNMTRLAS